MRKLLFLFVALLATTTLWAYDFKSGNLYYNITSDSTVEVTSQTSSYPYNEGVAFSVATIPSSVTYIGTTYSVTGIGDWAFGYSYSLTSITIPNSVTSIGNYAFYGCTSLTSITIPNSVESTGRSMCSYCYDLCSVIIGNCLKHIGLEAFYSCSSLTSVTIPNSVTSIGNYAFSRCRSLTSIYVEATTPPSLGSDGFDNTSAFICSIPCGTKAAYEASDWAQYMGEFVEEGCVDSTMIITYTSTDGNIITPNNPNDYGANIISNTYENGVGTITFDGPVTSIGDYAFQSCYSLTSITIPNSVTSIGEWAFSDCSSLASVTIPESVTSIGNYAFIGCTSLTSITIPNSVTSIVNNAFIGCTSLTSMVVETGNTIYDSRDNCNAIIETATNSLIAGCQNTIIPNSVTSIGERAFSSCSSLTSITIPNSVTSIGERAFQYCSSLTCITIPNSVTSIGKYAFSSCSSLASVTIPNSVTSIGEWAFSNCSSLTSITIPNSVTSIGEYAFYLCTSLTSITIPNSVTSIGKSAFLSGNSLTSIILTGSTIESFCQSTTNKQLYNAGAYYNRKIELNNQEINDLIIPNSVTSIEDYAFYNCSSLASVTIPNSVTSIGEWAFSNCSSLDTIYVEASTPPAFGVEVFTNAPISTCYIPCLTTAAYEASDWAQYMGEFVEDCEQCGDSLYWKYKDTQLSIIGHGEMYDYDPEPQPWQQYRNKMQTISLPEGMTSIGASAFADCKFLKNATIPSSVKEIRYSAFEDCRSLSSLTFAEPSALTSIGNWAFYNCHKLQHVTIPEGVTEIGEAAFFNCTYLDELTLPASMEYIADNGFALCAKLRRMNVNGTTPPEVEARTFEDVDRTIPVVVPDESVSVYKSAPVWQEFNIVSQSGVSTKIDDVDASTQGTQKLLRNGNLVIIRDGVEYNTLGQAL